MLIPILNLLGSLLETGEHGAFTAGQVLAGVAMLADFRKHFLHDNKLVGDKGKIHRKFTRTGKPLDIQDGIGETEQVAEYGVILLVQCL